MAEIITGLYQNGYFSSIDIRFADLVARLNGEPNPDLLLAAALVSRSAAEGHTCLDLSDMAGQMLMPESSRDPVICPPLETWKERLLSSRVVGLPHRTCPLILKDGHFLYLYRYWEYETHLAEAIRKRAIPAISEIRPERLRRSLDRLFPRNSGSGNTDQKTAALTAVMRNFCVISGGPGTGKTFTVTRILAMLLEQAYPKPFTICLAAPTGKAAARLGDSIRQARSGLNCSDAIKRLIPREASTLHRLLKPIPGSVYFRHCSENPVSADLVVVDEASMVDLALMAKLFQAIPLQCRLILLGDRDQLASVEAGSVLGDICGRKEVEAFSGSFCRRAEELSGESPELLRHTGLTEEGLVDSIVVLKKSYRFSPGTGIGELSRQVKAGHHENTMSLLTRRDEEAMSWKEIRSVDDLVHALSETVLETYYEPFLTAATPDRALDLLSHFQILCAVRNGPFGVSGINRIIETMLSRMGLIARHPDRVSWYHGKPVLITCNDYRNGLFNGDIGVASMDSVEKELYVYFRGPGGTIRRFHPFRLPQHETAYAMTVHKSQGSEFDHILLILPDADAAVLSRELIYTGITRARDRISVWGGSAILRSALSRQIIRCSGLRDALWQKTEGAI